MKRGELRKLAQAYETFILTPWQRVGSEFMRCEGDWVQIIAFNASRFSGKYLPRSCMEFLKMPGVPTGGFLVQELQNLNTTQRWVKMSENPADVFRQMVKQFNPRLLEPLDPSEVKILLTAAMNYWPHAYALCVMACQEANAVYAQRCFDAFVSATADKPYAWVLARKEELTGCLKLIRSPEALKVRLNVVRAEKLEALKFNR